MRIQESDIRIDSRHSLDARRELDIRSEFSFQAVFAQAAEAGEERAETEKERVMRLLQSLVDAILAAVEGRKCRGDAAACLNLPQRDEPASGGPTLSWKRTVTERIDERERTEVSARGTVRTADGKSIDFSLDLAMCREFSCERVVEESGSLELRDPLVVNFDGKAAELTGERFDFDLDADGKVERLAGLGEGSGFLVLDRNGNGKADDGSELFGARSGDGFADLAALDGDGNGWLDEADPEFARLQVWRGGGDGRLTGLADEGIGALWLGRVASPFALKDEANRLLGEIRASGLYLREDGRAGTLQQVDLAVDTVAPAARDVSA